MPLKHPTETFLIFLLGIIIALTGLLLATLPSLPEGTLPWIILQILTIVYPISLASLFRKNRADYPFRWLHWFPAAMALTWFLVQVVGQSLDNVTPWTEYYTWGWTIVPVAIGFVLIALFCLSVIRRRWKRLFLLALVLVPFAALAITSETGKHWDSELAATLWGREWFKDVGKSLSGTGSDTEVAMTDTEQEKNLETSEDPAEEEWRERLRAFERRRERIAARMEDAEQEDTMMKEDAMEGDAMKKDVSMMTDEERLKAISDVTERKMTQEDTMKKTGTGMEYREAKSQPNQLPHSGPGLAVFVLSVIGLYFAVVHSRAVERA